MKYYTAYLLLEECRQRLMHIFRPKFQKVIGHHVTHTYDVPAYADLPDVPEQAFIIGQEVDYHGLQVLIVQINDQIERPNGKLFHLTWSLNPNRFKPVDSNKLLEDRRQSNGKYWNRTIPIQLIPQLLS